MTSSTFTLPRARRTKCVRHRRIGAFVLVAIFASLLLAQFARADTSERWRVHPAVGLLDLVTLRVHWFESSDDLREAAKNSGQDINETGLYGFSILKRNGKTGEYFCDIYVVRMTRSQVDGDHTTTFGHEVLHCFGLRHE